MLKATLVSFILFLGLLSQAQDAMYDICPIKNSENAPKSLVYNTEGEQIDLKEYISDKPTILVFYRGGWCPYCMRHLSALHEVKDEIDSLGFELIGITPDDFSKLDTSIIRSGADEFTLFSDKDINAINAYGIGWKVNDELYNKYKEKYNMDTEWWSGSTHHVLPVPAVFIIKNGVIQFQHIDPNYSQRLSPSLLLEMLKLTDL